MTMTNGPHQGQEVLHTGAALEGARAAMILIHGRGASAQDILSLTGEFAQPDGSPPDGVAFLAPQAADNTWYPYRFMEPIGRNEPWLSSALAQVGALLDTTKRAGIPLEKTILLGFSQGACLTLEYAARNAQRYGGVVALSGGLIGPDGTPRDYPEALDGTPVFLGCSDVDFHIPVERVHESAEIMQRLGGDVTKRIYPGMGHNINEDEMTFVAQLLAKVAQ